MLIIKRITVVCFLLALTAVVQAQPQKVVADKITAIASDRIILHQISRMLWTLSAGRCGS
jgi:hypothetical protein